MSDAPTPSQRIITAANATETIVDERGRSLEVRRTTKLEVRTFTRNCGTASDIERWFGEALVAAQVRAIDGVPVIFPQNAMQADALVAKLDNEGIAATALWATGGSQEAPTDPTQPLAS